MSTQFTEAIKDFVGAYQVLKDAEQMLVQKQARLEVEAQVLRIGIMGQVKAGKSSFLNALLFNGQPILPEAATPKTANLTKIGYGDQYELKVQYYLASEWQSLQKQAQSSDESQQTLVAKELVQMASGLSAAEIERCLAQQCDTFVSADLDGLQGLLNQYTGNNGSHTPLVKCTELRLPQPELLGFEVVDTPGMNDPVISRTQQTKEFMAECDVVFFLSRCSQFLDKADSDLLIQQLPSRGIKRLVLVGGQFDSAVLDDGYDRDSLAATEQNLKIRLTRTAQQKADAIQSLRGMDDDVTRQMVIDSLSAPIFASTFAHGFANWEQSRWSNNMRHVHQQLLELAEDEWDAELSLEDWQRLANFEALTNAYETARADKDVVLAENRRRDLPEAYKAIQQALTKLDEEVAKRADFIRTKEVADIDKAKAEFNRCGRQISQTLSSTLQQAIANARQQSSQLMNQLQQDQQRFANLATRTGSREEPYSYEVSDSKWYKPWTWGSSRTVYSTRSVSYDYMKASEAVEQVNHFSRNCVEQIQYAFGKLIAPNELKMKLRASLLESVQQSQSDDFDPVLFKSLLESFVGELCLPVLMLDSGDHAAIIANQFQGQVTDASQMDSLRRQLASALSQVLGHLRQQFDREFTQVEAQLQQAGDNLEQKLMLKVNEQLDAIALQMRDKKSKLAEYQTLQQALSDELQRIKQV